MWAIRSMSYEPFIQHLKAHRPQSREGQPKLDNGSKKSIGLEGMMKYTKPDSVDIMDPNFKFRPML